MYLVAKVKSINYIKKFDYILFISVVALTVLGLVVLKSATMSMKYGASIYNMQVKMVVAGMLTAIVTNFIDYRFYKSVAIYLYIISIFLLVAVLFTGQGENEVGASSWLSVFGLFQFQPSEIAKITFVLLLSAYFEKIYQGERGKYIWLILVFAVTPILLIVKQPDIGTAMAFIVSFIFMLFIYGMKYRYILISGGIFGAMFPVLWKFILKPFQKERILSFFNPELQTEAALYQINKAKIAISSGQIFGQGLYNGIQTQNNGIPIKESDFIFSVIGEELGFLGAAAVIVLFAIIILRCFYIAATADDMYGTFVACGIGGIYMFHFLQNVGMNVGLLPITGIPLPFVSAGGSSMVTNYIALGVILSVSIRRKGSMFEKTNV